MISTEGSSATAQSHRPHHGLEKLVYRVIDSSSFSPNYRPEAILEDNPTEQASRWSSAANDQHQYIILKLDRPALICTSFPCWCCCKLTLAATITFGKFHKSIRWS